MPQPQELLTTQAFAKKAGVSSGTVSKWIRSGKIDGQKINGRWRIASDEISKVVNSSSSRPQSSAPANSKPTPKAPPSLSGGSTYSVEDFSKMTYLTEYGVKLWLKTGRLIGGVDDKGGQGVAAVSLDQPHIKRLLR